MIGCVILDSADTDIKEPKPNHRGIRPLGLFTLRRTCFQEKQHLNIKGLELDCPIEKQEVLLVASVPLSDLVICQISIVTQEKIKLYFILQ